MSEQMTEQIAKKKIKSIMKDNIAYRKVKGAKKGDLCHSTLYKAKISDRVFEVKGIMSKKKYKVALVVDCSGSMDWHEPGNRSIQAANATMELVKVFSDVADVAVYGFNTLLYTFKKFGENVKNVEEIGGKIKRLAALDSNNHSKHIEWKYLDPQLANRVRGGNHDAYCLEQVYEQIRKQDGKKIMIVLSDGKPKCDDAPDCGNPGCASHEKQSINLKKIVKYIQKNKIDIFGIGIANTSIADYYPHSYYLENPNMIYNYIINGLRKIIKRGV